MRGAPPSRARAPALWAAVVATAAAGCAGVTYVAGPSRLGQYVGSGLGGPVAEHEGQLDPKDGMSARGSYADTFTVFGQEDELLTVSMTSGDLDSYLLVVDGAGRVLGENDDSGGGLNSELGVRLPSDGLYLVVATSYERESGSYRLRVGRPGGRAEYPFLALPAELQRRFSSPGPQDASGNPYHVYALEVRGGSELSARLTSGQADALLRLFDAAGHEVASDDDSGGSLNAHLVYTPPSAGRYYLVATTYAPPRPFGGATYYLAVTQ